MSNFSVFLTLAVISFGFVASHPSAKSPINKRDPMEFGPISEKVMLANPNLGFLGAFNGSFFYIERTAVNQVEAGKTCAGLGMKPTKFQTQAELNFVADEMEHTDDYAWTTGYTSEGNDAYVWTENETSPGNWVKTDIGNILLEIRSSAGLTVSRYEGNSKLHTADSNELHFALCMI